MPEFIANLLITVAPFCSGKGKTLSAFLTALPQVLGVLHGVDEPTVDLLIAASVAFLTALLIYISVVPCLPCKLLHY